MDREDVDCRDCSIGKAVFDGGCVGDEDCHLTTDTRRFINAMIRGVFDCGHCANRPEMVCVRDGEDDSFGVFEEEWPCEDWQERKEGEDV